MKYKIPIILFLLVLVMTSVKSQDDEFWEYETKSSLDTVLSDIEYARNTINERLIILDSLFDGEKISNSDYFAIGKIILTLKDPNGYKLLLSNFTKFSFQRFMSPNDIINGGKVLVLDVVLRASTRNERKSLVDYLFYSNYLDEEMTTEELNYIKKLFRYFRDEYRAKYIKREFSLQKEANLEAIFKN